MGLSQLAILSYFYTEWQLENKVIRYEYIL